MKLSELHPHFLKIEDDKSLQMTDALEGADGVQFLCPKCFRDNGGRVGTHSIICWFKGKVPATKNPRPGRWNPSGTGYADLSFVPPGNTSVLQIGGCGAHFFLENGEVRFV